MNARNRIVAVLGALVLLAGCGGDDGSGGAKPSPAPPVKEPAQPRAKEPLAAAAKRLERTLPGGDCKALARLMLHSIPWPGAQPTAGACKFIARESHNELGGFRLTKTREFGPAGMTEGSGRAARPEEVAGVVWAIDEDGSWKSVYNAVFRTQIGVRPDRPAAFEQNARRFVAATATADCAQFWRLLNVGSRFVRGVDGNMAKFCGVLADLYKDRSTAFAQIRAEPAAHLKELGTVRDFGFYGLGLENGRYMVIVMGGRLGNIADDEQVQHDDPSVLELVSVRQPGG